MAVSRAGKEWTVLRGAQSQVGAKNAGKPVIANMEPAIQTTVKSTPFSFLTNFLQKNFLPILSFSYQFCIQAIASVRGVSLAGGVTCLARRWLSEVKKISSIWCFLGPPLRHSPCPQAVFWSEMPNAILRSNAMRWKQDLTDQRYISRPKF